jgi:predicted GIY-YIG superfamily endonuclease
MYYVYELVNLLGTIEYVGQTKDPSYRLLAHKSKPNSNGAGKFFKRQDISMHIVATYATEEEARDAEEILQLFWGLPTDRSKCGGKGIVRNPGEGNPMAKLDEDKVREIRKFHKRGFSNQEIATLFNVCRPNISLIVRGKAWKHVK